MRIGFVGCVESSLMGMNTLLLLRSSGIEVVAVITKQKSNFNADHVDLSDICKDNDIPYHFEDSSNKYESLKFMESYSPDIIYCFGWSYLLSNDFLNIAPQGVIGFHPAKLPQNRGRHPIIWALVLGLRETASTFFKIEHEADSGPILSQATVSISLEDDANVLYRKILDVAQSQIEEFTLQISKGTAKFRIQNQNEATSWRKRNCKDGHIDWRMHALDIYNLIRALAKPYPGAEFECSGIQIRVFRSKVCETVFPINLEPGLILKVHGSDILVRSGHNTAIWLLGVDMIELPKVGEYL